MRWKLFATLSEAAGSREVDVSVAEEQSTLQTAFAALLEQHPELEGHVVDEDGTLYDHIRLLCDGADPFHGGDGWETDLDEIDELALFPPVSGG